MDDVLRRMLFTAPSKPKDSKQSKNKKTPA